MGEESHFMLPVNARPSLFAVGSIKRIVAAAVVVGVGAGVPVVAATAANAAPVKSAPVHSVQAAAPQAPAGYTVQSGDSLTKIATTHHVQGGWQKLYDLNKSVLTDGPDKIHPGQHLTLGGAAPAPAAASAKPAAATPVAAAAPVANTPAALQALAASIVPANQLASFDQIISHESGWNIHATNPSSGAYGLPQALPGNKMASAGSDWQNNPATQLKWALQYMNTVYGSPNAAWAFWQVHHAY
ncbi:MULTISPECIES: LysM peptidoglycan-binding domain-containing protein [Kitasatospora]|uniref:LysM peptidoglycan-binding domain-containing protein n=1 Tax=Kitasatospora cathayae TaxID=3004092 RepID=A0ABY7QDE1_9ACTN|nr:LysM peptidoglycan-binding domain-containing protein [Kitasatospora sp. HUAS 3-15]WBP90566.1 LysM peptidoglycan-binding domain-containing protein [Kitasatospora sp. HUAS 3-15]